MFFLAATLIGYIGDFLYRKVAAENIFAFEFAFTVNSNTK